MTDIAWFSRFVRHPEQVYSYNPAARTAGPVVQDMNLQVL